MANFNHVKNYFAEIQVDKVYFTIFSQEFIWSEKISRMKDCHPFKSRPKYDIVKKRKKKSAMFLFSPFYYLSCYGSKKIFHKGLGKGSRYLPNENKTLS